MENDETGAIRPKRSVKSRMKKRPEDWEALKVEIAQELGLWTKVCESGWSGLSAVDSGRLGGVFAARRARLEQAEAWSQYEEAQRESLSAAGGWDEAGPGNRGAEEIAEDHFYS
ncbi:MAG: hypothetical protein IK116_01105 [Firmicutes bacterium]|nr:hypothetical protein [Bacillota bacterium]